MSVRLLDNRILVAPITEETSGGILIPTNAQQKSDTGVVKAIGTGKLLDDGQRLAVSVKVGDKVLYGKYAGTEVKLDGEELMIIREDDIMGVIE